MNRSSDITHKTACQVRGSVNKKNPSIRGAIKHETDSKKDKNLQQTASSLQRNRSTDNDIETECNYDHI